MTAVSPKGSLYIGSMGVVGGFKVTPAVIMKSSSHNVVLIVRCFDLRFTPSMNEAAQRIAFEHGGRIVPNRKKRYSKRIDIIVRVPSRKLSAMQCVNLLVSGFSVVYDEYMKFLVDAKLIDALFRPRLALVK